MSKYGLKYLSEEELEIAKKVLLESTDEEDFDDEEEYDQSGFRYLKGVWITPEWIKTQGFYKSLYSDRDWFKKHEDDWELVKTKFPENFEFDIPMPHALIRVAEWGNVGFDVLMTWDGNTFKEYEPEGSEDWGASGPAFNGCYDEESTKEIIKWCDEVIEDIEKGNDIWL
jgi:hypothetical protein